MDPWSALNALLFLFLLALTLGAICERFRLGGLIGYLLAGTITGPAVLGLMERGETLDVLAEMGVSLLLFAIGLEFSWGKLKSTGSRALLAGLLQVALTVVVGWMVAMLFGVGVTPALVIGSVVALSSTACVLPLLASRAEMDSGHGRQALAMLLVQDLAVIVLVLLIDAVAAGGSQAEAGLRLLSTLGSSLLLVAGFWIAFHVIVPRILVLQSMQSNRELPILLAAASGIGSAVLAHMIGISPAMGAFIAGMLLAESQFATQIRSDVGPLRTLLMVLFFGSVGMLADLGWIAANLPLVMGVLILALFGKALLIFIALRIFRVPVELAITCGIMLAQTGEFGFVLMGTAQAAGAFPPDLFQLMVAVTVFALFATTFLVRFGGRWGAALAAGMSRMGLVKSLVSTEGAVEASNAAEVLVVGFGPAGQSVVDSFEGHGVQFHVVDVNPRARDLVGERGAHFHLGDAASREVLEHLGIKRMRAVVITLPDTNAVLSILRHLEQLAPQARCFVRGRYHMHLPRLLEQGADEVASEEQLVGLELARGLTGLFRGEAARLAPDGKTGVHAV